VPEGLASRYFAYWTVFEKFRWYAGRKIIVYSLAEFDEKYDDAIRQLNNFVGQCSLASHYMK
jgi:hypothetical protein